MAVIIKATSLVLSEQVSPPRLELQPSILNAPTPGSAIVQVLSTSLLSYTKPLLAGKMPYPLSLPMTPGGGAVVRIVSIPSDATSLAEGQLCFLDPTIKARDEPNNQILLGIHGGATPAARSLMHGPWRNGSWSTHANVPLENLYPLDEDVLCSTHGYSFHDLAYLTKLAVPCGGLMDALDVKLGECIVIAPATGSFGGAAVEVARGLGADVIMCGRNKSQLDKMRNRIIDMTPHAGKVDVVVLTGRIEDDTAAISKVAIVDKYLDFSPPAAADSTHIASCLMNLKRGGIACFQGGIPTGVTIPYGLVMFNDLTIKGKFMYTRDASKRLIRLVQGGNIKLGREKAGVVTKSVFALEEWREAIDAAEQENGWGVQICFEPGKGL